MNPIRKKRMAVLAVAAGGVIVLAILALGRILPQTLPRSLRAGLLGVGITIMNLAVMRLLECQRLAKRDPKLMERIEIARQDERNMAIRARAGEKAGNVTQWLVMGLVYVMIFLGMPYWFILLGTGVFASHAVLKLYFYARFEKEM